MDAPSPHRGESFHRPVGSARPPLGIATLIATIAPGLVVFALPTVGLISRNQEFFRGDYSAGRNLYLLALLVISVGFALWVASRWRAGRFLWTAYLLVTPGWLLYTALGGWDRLIVGLLVVTLILTTAWFFHRQHASIKNVGLLSVLLLAVSIITTMLDVRDASAESGAPQQIDTVVSTPAVAPTVQVPNIYHVVLDEYQTEMFEVTLDSEVRRDLSGFNYYPDARTTYGRTEMSMASILGPSDYDYEKSPQDFVDASWRGPDSSLQELRRAGYRTTGFSHLPSLYGSPSPFDEAVLLSDYVQFDPRDDHIILADSLWLYAHTPAEAAQRLLPEDHYAALEGENLLPSEAPAVSVLSLEKFIDRERELPSAGRYTLIHLILPHFPYVMSADCEYTEGEETAPSEQAACTTSLIVDLVEELKDLNRFESSHIVIHGDHGARFGMAGDELRQVPQDFGSEEWNEARSRSLLLIKPAGADAEEPLAVSEYPALLTDIMPTLFDSIDVPFVSRDGRISLLADELPERPTRFYHFYDKGDDGLPDGELTRWVIEGDGIRYERTIQLPD